MKLEKYLTGEEQTILIFMLFFAVAGLIGGWVVLESKEDFSGQEADSLALVIASPARMHYDINTVTVEQLMTIRGIGRVRAESIVAYRDENMPIVLDDLLNVRGIGEKTLETIRGYFQDEGGDVAQKDTIHNDQLERNPAARTNINGASLDSLTRVSGIGQVRGELIISFIEERGRIKNIDQLLEIRGVGQKTLENIKELFYADEN